MSEKQEFEIELAKLDQDTQYLVRDCAHQVQQLLDRYRNPHLVSLATELVSAQLQDSLKY